MKSSSGTSGKGFSFRSRRFQDWLRLCLLGGIWLATAWESRAALSLQLPTIIEGTGVLTNGGNFRLGQVAASNLLVTLTSSDPALVTVPASATILAGQSNVTFNLVVADDAVVSLTQPVTIAAQVPGFGGVSNTFEVLENDAHHIRFAPVAWGQMTNTGFGLLLTAEDADGKRLTNFYGRVEFSAVGLEGALPLQPTNSDGFAAGQRFLTFTVGAPGRVVRILSAPIPGASDAFNVGLPVFWAAPQAVADIAWHAGSQTLFATVPATGGVYSNRLVAIDPATGLVTNSYPLGGTDAGQIELAPSANWLYVALSNSFALQRFDINTRVAGLKYALGSNPEPRRFAYDFCVPSGLTDSVVVETRDQDVMGSTYRAGLARYDGGVPVALPNFDASGGWLLESLPSGSQVLLSSPLAKGNAATGAILATAANTLRSPIKYRDGFIYDDGGNYYSAAHLGLEGAYPGVLEQFYHTALAEVNPARRRMFYLAGYFNYGASFYKLRVYDRDLRQPLFEFGVPSSAGSPARFISYGSNGLAYVTGNRELWFIRPDLIQSDAAPADLQLSITSAMPVAVVGTDYNFTLTLSNAGPGLASIVRITNTLPANVTVLATSASTGRVALASSAFMWTVAPLPPGSNATLQVTARFGTAGWQTNLAVALGFETDPVAANNSAPLPLYVELPAQGLGVFPMNAASEAILYDPVRDRLLLAVGEGGAGANNGLAVLDPYRGLVDSFTPLTKRPGPMARSDDGQFLYVSLPAEALVRRLMLTNLSQNLEFALGGEDINGTWYPFYAADLAVAPGNPNSLAAWRVRRAGPMATEYGWGIAWFDSGVMRPEVTAAGGNWRLEFDPDTGTLFGLNGTDLRRCDVAGTGVTFAETYPALANGAGSDLEFAGGRFFTSAGRALRAQPFGVTSLYAGSESALLVEPDSAAGRVFYLALAGSIATVRAYDVERLALLGSVTITNVLGVPSDLIRWGTNGLAFRTSSNQLFLVRSPLVSPVDSADVRVNLVGPTTPVAVNSNANFTVTLSNQGPATVAVTWVTNTISPAALVTSVACTNGVCFTNDVGVVWALSNLVAGTQATLSFAAQRSQTGDVAMVCNAASSAPDPVAQDNVAVAAWSVGPSAAGMARQVRNLPARDLIWVPTLGRLLLTASTNLPNGDGLLLSVDPVTLALNREANLSPGAGRMSRAGDDSRVYLALDYGVEERALPSFAFQRRFLLGRTGGREQATDLEVLPGLPQSLGVLRVDNFNAAFVGVCDDGVLRSNLAAVTTDAAGEILEVGNDPNRLYVQNFGTGGFRRYNLTASGATLVDSDTTLLPTLTPLDLDWGEGRIYSSVGRVIDPETRQLLASIPNLPTGSLVRYDAPTARVLFLSPGVSSATLRVYDAPTLLPVGSTTIPGAVGTLGSFVRWGADGLAFTTSSNQLWILNTSLLPTNPPADIAVTLAAGPPPHIAGSNLLATILITNAGPNEAAEVVWTNLLPAGAVVQNAVASQGSLNVAGNIVSGRISSLSTGAVASVTVTFTASSTGVTTNQVVVLSSSLDPAFANNSATALLWIQSPSGLPSLLSLNLPVKDVVRDPIRPLLYASLGSTAGPLADSIVTIDPANGDITGPVRVGSDPGRMAASPDGQFLYVGLDGAGTVQKLALPQLTLLDSFSVPQNQRVSNLVVSPVNPNLVALWRTPGARLTLHENGIARPTELADKFLFAFSESTGDLFGCNGYFSNIKLYRLDIGPTGLKLQEGQPGKPSQSAELKSSGGLLFYDRGMVINPDTGRVRAVMPVPGNSLVEPDTASGRVFYLTPGGSAWTLRAFDIAQGIEVGNVALPALGSAPRRLLRWGTNGLALFTTNSQLVILRGQLVPTNPPVDVVLSQTASVLMAATNQTLNFSLELTNRGPVTIPSVVVTQLLSLTVTNIVLTPSIGTVAFTNGAVIWQAGMLPTGSVATLSVSLRSLQSGTLNATASAYHDLNDSFWGNNFALTAVQITNAATASVLQLRLATRELSYDPVRDVLYASTPASNRLAGNLITVINPTSGRLERAFAAGSEPDQLTLAKDASVLYTSLNGAMGAKRFDLAAGSADLDFQFGTNDIFYAHDLEVRPGYPNMVAASLGSFNLSSPYPSTVMLYQGGNLLTNQSGTARGLSFSADGQQLYGYFSPGVGSGFVRMGVSDSGIVSTESLAGFTTIPGDLKFSNGRLYSSSGQMLEPTAPFLIGSFTGAGPHTVEAETGRAFYLTQSGANWELRAFALGSLTAIGTQVVANVQGTPTSLVRCGADRLAFRTSSNQLFIIRSPLVSTNVLSPTDLAVSQQVRQDFAAPGEPLRFIITVTNLGPAPASNVLLTIKSPVAASTSLQVPLGTVTNAGGNYLCNLGSLAVYQSLQLTLSAVITNTGSYSNLVSLSAATPEINPADNSSLARMTGLFFQRSDTSKRVAASARALAYDPVRGRLFAALGPAGTNQLAWFDPETGLMQGTLPIGLSPTSLLVTDNGQYLYLSATTTGLVQRVDLAALTVDLSFTPLAGTAIGAMATVPGAPQTVVLSFWNATNYVTGVFDNGGARSNLLIGSYYRLLAVTPDGATVFGYDNGSTGGASPDVFRMSLSAGGLQPLDYGPSDTPWGNNVAMEYLSNRLVFANGNVLNPTPWQEETNFTLPYWGLGLAPIPTAGLVAFLTADFNSSLLAHLSIYSYPSRQLRAQFDLQLTSTTFDNLVYCGADRLAFRSGNEIIFVRSSVIPSADLVLRTSLATNQIMVGVPLNLQLTVSNAGPYATTGVWLTNTLPAGFDLLSLALSQGQALTNGSSLITAFGPLPTNATASMTLVIKSSLGSGSATNFATITDPTMPDAIRFNNQSVDPILVVPLDSDADGLPDEWELAYGLNPTNAIDGALDSDCDGVTNLQEYQAGQNPVLFENPRLTTPRLTGSGKFEATLEAGIGKFFTIEASPNLISWQPVTTVLTWTQSQTVEISAAVLPASYFRLRTDTNAPRPVLTLLSPPFALTNPPLLRVAAPPGRLYSLQASTNLNQWTTISNFFGLDCTTIIADPTTNVAPVRYYRILLP